MAPLRVFYGPDSSGHLPARVFSTDCGGSALRTFQYHTAFNFLQWSNTKTTYAHHLCVQEQSLQYTTYTL